MARAARLLSLILALSISSVLSSSSAGAVPANKPAAEALFEDGRRLLDAGRVAEACGKFEASQELDSGVGTLLFVGDCNERLGRYASAWAAFMEAASLARARSDATRESIAATRAKALRAKVPRLTLRVPRDHRVAGLEIRIDGQSISEASWNVAIPVDPGSHRLDGSAPGKQGWSAIVELAQAGEQKLVVVPRLSALTAPAPASASQPARSQPRDRAPNGGRVLGIVVGSAGVVAIAVGSVLGLSARAKNDDSLAFCPRAETLCDERGKELRDEARGLARASTATFAGGAALLATGIVLLVTARGSEQRPNSSEQSKRGSRLRLDLGSRSAGLELEGRF